MREVKTCPFCGGEATIIFDDGLANIPDGYCVECKDCKTAGNHFSNADAAVAWWNTRVDDEQEDAAK